MLIFEEHMSKYNKSLFESIKDSLNRKNTPDNTAFKDILKLEKNKTYIVRLVPNVEDFDKTFFHYYSHIWKSCIDDSLINVFCPNSYGERCPIDEFRSKIWKSGSEEDKEAVKPLKRNENWMVNVYVIKDPTNPENQGQLKTLRYGKQLAKVINDAISGDDADEFGEKVFDLSPSGCNLKIKVDENEGGYATYTASRFQSASEIDGLENVDAVYESVKSFDDMFKHQSYDEIKMILDKHWFGNVETTDSDDYDGDSAGETKETKKASKKSEPEAEPEAEDHNVTTLEGGEDEDLEKILNDLK